MAFTPRDWKDAPEGYREGIDPVPNDATPLDAAGQEDQEVRLAAYTDTQVAAEASARAAADATLTTAVAAKAATTALNTEIAARQAADDALTAQLSGKYVKPGGGIPAADLAADVATQAELDAVAAAAIPRSLVDAKGDVLAASADNAVARVAVGADGTVLTADAASAAGVKWSAPSGGSGVDLSTDFGPFAAGKGIVLTSPDGTQVRRVRIDNDGTLVTEDPSGPTGYAAAVLADSPLSYWRLGEASGTTAVDATAAHPGTYVGGVTLGTAGLTADGNKAVTLDGANGHVVGKADGAILGGLANWTIEALIKNAGGPGGNIYAERGSSGSDILRLEAGGNGRYGLTYRDHDGVINQFQSTDGHAVDGTAHHVVLTKAGATVKFYEDGTLIGTFTLTASDTFGEPTVQSWIGGEFTSSAFLPGVIDEVALYDHALTSGQIAAHLAAVAA